MTRVLVVHHDVDVADILADQLRRAGYDVDQCAGPSDGAACPVLNGQPCWQVDAADVLVYDMSEPDDARRDLSDDVRALHPDKPIVGTSPAGLVDAIEAALKTRPAPHALEQTQRVGLPHLHRW